MGLPSSYSSSGWGGQSSLGSGITSSGASHGSYTFGGWGSRGGSSSSGGGHGSSSSGSSIGGSSGFSAPKAPNQGAKAGSGKGGNIGGAESNEVESVAAHDQNANDSTISEYGFENNYTTPADFSWVTPTSPNSENKNKNDFNNPWSREDTKWDQMAKDAREQEGKNQRLARNWTYAGDWRKGPNSVTNVEHNTNVSELDKAWEESKNLVNSLNNQESLVTEVRNAANPNNLVTFNSEKASPNEFAIGASAKEGITKDAKDKVDQAESKMIKEQNNVSSLVSASEKLANLREAAYQDIIQNLAKNGIGFREAREIVDTIKAGGVDSDLLANGYGTNDPKVTKAIETALKAEDNLAKMDERIATANERYKAASNELAEAKKEYNRLVEAEKAEAEKEYNRLIEAEKAEATRKFLEGSEKPKYEEMEKVSDKVESIDVENVTDANSAMNVSEELSKVSNELAETANVTYRGLVESFLADGGKLQDIAKNENIKAFSNDLFRISQRIYDKVSRLEEISDSYGINNLSRKDIAKNLDEISINVDRLAGNIGKEGSSLGTYYSPGSDMGGIGATGVNLTKSQQKALAEYSKSVTATKDAMKALMKAAAFNGAVNIEGEKYSEAWKNAPAMKEDYSFKAGLKEFFKNDNNVLTWKDYAALGVKGFAGMAATIFGGVLCAVNPVAGAIMLTAGITTMGKAGVEIHTTSVRADSTNAEAMFTNSGSRYYDIFNDIHNRSFEEANFGDIKSVGTYTNLSNGFINGCVGMALLSNPFSAPMSISYFLTSYEQISAVVRGGLKGNLNTAISTVYKLGKNINEWSDMGIDLSSYMSDPNKGRKLADEIIRTSIGNGSPSGSNYRNVPSSDFGISKAGNAENKYSGFAEEAKNSNLATDYNAGMEEEVNEAVSDERVKGYVVKIYQSEPDWFRKALDKVLKMHSEREW